MKMKRRMEGRREGPASKRRPGAGVQLGTVSGSSDVCTNDVGVIQGVWLRVCQCLYVVMFSPGHLCFFHICNVLEDLHVIFLYCNWEDICI